MSDPLAINDREVLEIHVPEWKCTVFVRSLSAEEQFDLETAEEGVKDPKQILALELAAYLCSQDGSALYSLEQAHGLLKRKPGPLYRIAKAAKKLNAWTLEEQENLKGN